ncbi:Aspartate/methionine/tyrosine aminotransferase [Aliiroseovarius halocynthiae]|uniref:aspartate transaminase n=1 Tax=Aliiroseovarius halocynthiae TaxID=985055 RepID=A0A545SWT9_9RHOB|nr:aminotransferase [Aliiroseovarius halocynthiae]TQV69420.1 aminotransferase [Aliiroseovarius halocynthiae]SMR72813.1 Aspartate/methionine/tyrosine aminotransferase [Aliiroseovarius halocynthiae]
MLLNPNLANTFSPPVMEARRWLEGKSFSSDLPLINVSQAAPVDPPPEAMRAAMADAIMCQPETHLYGPVLGLSALRDELAFNINRHYGAEVTAANIAITSGCNQAFAATVATLAAPGDEVILPTPWYFNHKMWLDMGGIHAAALPTGADLLPDPDEAAAMITPRTRAIALVTPNNPTGVEYPADLVTAFRDLARARGIALIIDETYRDFHSCGGAPHALFSDPDWDDTVIQLYSFSKSYRLTGHRVGSVLTSPARLAEIEKFLDTVTICPAQLGQHAALWGLRNLDGWLAEERIEILSRAQAMRDGFAPLAERGWKLMGCGAYFAYLQHPFEMRSDQLAQALVDQASILALPGTMFTPEGDKSGAQQLRVAFANIDATGIQTALNRLVAFQR